MDYLWNEVKGNIQRVLNDSGGAAVDAFIQSMGYTNTKGFQGWWNKKDGTRIHGIEDAKKAGPSLYGDPTSTVS